MPQHNQRRVFLLCLFFLLGGAGVCLADEVDKYLDMNLKDLLNIDVVTASRSWENLPHAPATMVVLTKQQIKERGYMNLLDLLEDLPGVDVNRKSTEQFFNQVAIRGNAGNNLFIVMQDGVRINSPTGENIPVADNFPLYQAERVEVLYGGASAIYGADAFTGVINIITKKGADLDGVKVASYAGTDGYLYEYVNAGTKFAGKWDVVFGGHWHDDPGPDLSKAYPGVYAPVNLFTTGGALAIPAARREPFVAPQNSYSSYAQVSYDDKFTMGMTRSFLRHPTTTSNLPVNTVFSNQALWGTLIETYNGKYRFQPADKLTSETALTYSAYTVPSDSMFTNNTSNFASSKYAEGDKWEFDEKLDYRLNENHTVSGGATVSEFHSIPKTANLPSPYNPGLPANQQRFFYPNTNNTLPIQIFETYYATYGGFLNAQSRWNKWLSTSAGVRYDYDTRFNDTINSRIALIFDPAEQTVVKLMYGESFLAPAPFFAYQNYGAFNGTTNASGQYVSGFFAVPNPNLKPEKDRTVELSVAHDVTSDFVVSGSAYYSNVSQLITMVYINGTSNFVPGGQILSYGQNQNIGEAAIYGLEAKGDYRIYFGPVGVKLWGSYSWVDGNVTQPGGIVLQLPLIASHKVKTGATFTWRDFFITPKIDWIGESNAATVYGQMKIPAHTLVNLAAGVENVYKNLSLFVNVRNLTDIRYFVPDAEGSKPIPGAPQDPRQVIAGATYKF